MSQQVQLRPHAKINLGLFIQGKRADGYHLLQTAFYPIPLYDELTLVLTPGHNTTLVVEGKELPGSPADNLCWRAGQLIQARFPKLPGVKIILQKNIPAGAGLGGGSSDAAHTLIGLNQLFQLGLLKAELQAMALQLGADVPFFLENGPMLAIGIGEVLTPLQLTLPYRIEWITPPVHSDTATAYKHLPATDWSVGKNLATVLALPVKEWKHQLHNDFEPSIFQRFPQLAMLKQELYQQGAVYASLSGSGSALYGLFPLDAA